MHYILKNQYINVPQNPRHMRLSCHDSFLFNARFVSWLRGCELLKKFPPLGVAIIIWSCPWALLNCWSQVNYLIILLNTFSNCIWGLINQKMKRYLILWYPHFHFFKLDLSERNNFYETRVGLFGYFLLLTSLFMWIRLKLIKYCLNWPRKLFCNPRIRFFILFIFIFKL